jgi:hypothetical protein
MNKKLMIGTVLGVALVLLASCVTTKVFDENLPEDQMATVTFVFGATGIIVKSYNGIPVEEWYTVKIPAGDAEFVADLSWTAERAKDVTFGYRFEGGKEYILVTRYAGRNNDEPAIKIYIGDYRSEDNLLDTIVFERPKRVMTAGSE